MTKSELKQIIKECIQEIKKENVKPSDFAVEYDDGDWEQISTPASDPGAFGPEESDHFREAILDLELHNKPITWKNVLIAMSAPYSNKFKHIPTGTIARLGKIIN